MNNIKLVAEQIRDNQAPGPETEKSLDSLAMMQHALSERSTGLKHPVQPIEWLEERFKQRGLQAQMNKPVAAAGPGQEEQVQQQGITQSGGMIGLIINFISNLLGFNGTEQGPEQTQQQGPSAPSTPETSKGELSASEEVRRQAVSAVDKSVVTNHEVAHANHNQITMPQTRNDVGRDNGAALT